MRSSSWSPSVGPEDSKAIACACCRRSRCLVFGIAMMIVMILFSLGLLIFTYHVCQQNMSNHEYEMETSQPQTANKFEFTEIVGLVSMMTQQFQKCNERLTVLEDKLDNRSNDTSESNTNVVEISGHDFSNLSEFESVEMNLTAPLSRLLENTERIEKLEKQIKQESNLTSERIAMLEENLEKQSYVSSETTKKIKDELERQDISTTESIKEFEGTLESEYDIISELIENLEAKIGSQSNATRDNMKQMMMELEDSVANTNYAIESLQKQQFNISQELVNSDQEIAKLRSITTFNGKEVKKFQTQICNLYRTKRESARKGWFEISNGYRYKVLDTQQTWVESSQLCLELGGQLAAAGMRALEMRKQITEALPENMEKVWIGMNDLEEEGVWQWIDDQLATQTDMHWVTNEPNNWDGNEDCAAIKWPNHSPYGSVDIGCHRLFYGLCEKPIEDHC